MQSPGMDQRRDSEISETVRGKNHKKVKSKVSWPADNNKVMSDLKEGFLESQFDWD